MKINHRRKNPEKSYGEVRKVTDTVKMEEGILYVGPDRQNDGYAEYDSYQARDAVVNGYVKDDKSQHLYKGGISFNNVDKFSDKNIGALVSYEHCKGRRGMARDVRGAKKFIRSRTRFHSNAKTRKLMREYG